MPVPTVTTHGSGTPDPSTSQASESTLASNNVSTPASSSARQTARNPQVHEGYAASHLQYLEMKIKLLTSQMDSYTRDLVNDVNLIESKMSSYAGNVDNRIQLVNAIKDAHAEVVREIEYLQGRKDSHDYDLGTGELINKDSYPHDIVGVIELLSARKDVLARSLVLEVQLLKATHFSYVDDLNFRITEIYNNVDSFLSDMRNQCELLRSEKGPLALDFDIQIELLNSKLASFTHDYSAQEMLLISNIAQYSSDLGEKMKLLNSEMVSYLGQDFQLQYFRSNVLLLTVS